MDRECLGLSDSWGLKQKDQQLELEPESQPDVILCPKLHDLKGLRRASQVFPSRDLPRARHV